MPASDAARYCCASSKRGWAAGPRRGGASGLGAGAGKDAPSFLRVHVAAQTRGQLSPGRGCARVREAFDGDAESRARSRCNRARL